MKKKNADTEIVALVDKMHNQLVALEKKIDILISHTSAKPAGAHPAHKPFREHGNHGNGIQRSQGNNFSQRVLHKAVCAECKKECEVPFKPTGDRPVYCKDCFAKRKASSAQFKARPDSRPGAVAAVQAAHIAKPEAVIKKKPVEKKKPAAKKRKSKTK